MLGSIMKDQRGSDLQGKRYTVNGKTRSNMFSVGAGPGANTPQLLSVTKKETGARVLNWSGGAKARACVRKKKGFGPVIKMRAHVRKHGGEMRGMTFTVGGRRGMSKS